MKSHVIINILLTIILCYLVIYSIYINKFTENFDNRNCPTMPECNCPDKLIRKGGSFADRPFNRIFGNRTRGEPDGYMLVGILYNSTINKNYKLYGRRTYPGSTQWEYIIAGRDVGGLDIDVQLDTKNKDEIMDGSTITIPIDSNQYTVKMYNYNDLIYNSDPNIIYHA